jgi:CheY-like chemotaxis protein
MSSIQSRARRTVLLVEDEFLIADLLVTAFSEAGATIVGPAHTVADALKLIETTSHLDGAVLDINLKGEAVFPVADLLSARGTPFVFTTGYDGRSLDDRYKHIRRFQKPFVLSKILDAVLRPV